MPRLTRLPFCAWHIDTQAARARAGHTPPAASATANSGSHTFRGTIDNAIRQCRPGLSRSQADIGCPAGQIIAQLVALPRMCSNAKGLDMLVRSATVHMDDYRARHDGIGKLSESGKGGCAVDRKILYVVFGSNTPGNRSPAFVSGIQ